MMNEMWLQAISVITTVIVIAYYMHRDTKSDIREANARTDKLYEMFIEVLKEGKK